MPDDASIADCPPGCRIDKTKVRQRRVISHGLGDRNGRVADNQSRLRRKHDACRQLARHQQKQKARSSIHELGSIPRNRGSNFFAILAVRGRSTYRAAGRECGLYRSC
jgi:hypothetical protein